MQTSVMSAPFRIMPGQSGAYDFDLNFNPTTLMVKFDPAYSDTEVGSIISNLDGTVEWNYTRIGWKLLRFDYGIDAEALKQSCLNRNYSQIQRVLDRAKSELQTRFDILKDHPAVIDLNRDYFIRLFETDYVPNDPFFMDVDPVAGYNEPQQWTSFDVQLPEAWDVTQGSGDVLLAIIDTGVDTDHPDLEDNIARDLTGQVIGHDFVGGKNGTIFELILPVQEDNNPDIHHDDGIDDGWGIPDPSAGDGNDLLGLPSSECDLGVFHGTHCASIASGVTDNAEGVAGAGFSVKIMPVRCANPEGGLSEYIFGTVSVLTMGVSWAVENGADIISMSLGLPLEVSGLHDAIIDAYDSGVAIFAASGNSGANEIMYPAAYDEVFAVGSFSQSHNRADFSTYGSHLDALAGGGEYDGVNMSSVEWIWGCYVASVCDENNGGNPAGSHGYTGAIGTSMACPQAAGIAGLILSAAPGLSPEMLYNTIRATCLDIESPGWDIETGYGIIQARDAIDYALNPGGDITVSVVPSGSTIIPANGGSFQFNIAAANAGTTAVSFDAWTMATLPNGSEYGPIILVENLFLTPGNSVNRDRTQFVPANAPPGNYTYDAYVGFYPESVWSEDHFDFEKLAVSDGGVDVTNWKNWGEDFNESAPSSQIHHSSFIIHHSIAPNPFNSQATISFELRDAGFVSLDIFDVTGRSVGALRATPGNALPHNQYMPAGQHSVSFNAEGLTSGVYFVRLEAQSGAGTRLHSMTRKILLVK